MPTVSFSRRNVCWYIPPSLKTLWPLVNVTSECTPALVSDRICETLSCWIGPKSFSRFVDGRYRYESWRIYGAKLNTPFAPSTRV